MIFYISEKSDIDEAANALYNLLSGDYSKKYKAEVKEVKKKRTLSQNRLYWLYLTCIEQETGNNKDDLHDYFKNKWIKPQIREVFGEPLIKHPSTTKLNTSLFKQYIDKIIHFANTELNITLPDPSDKNFEYFKNYYSKYL